MFRSFLAVCVLTLSSTSVMANDFMDELFTDLLYGVAIMNQSADVTVGTGASATTTSEDGSGFSIFADKYYRGKYRFNGSFSYVDYDDFYISTAMAAADYLIPYNANITFFAGASAGGAIQVYSDSSLTDGALGLVYGVQLGGIAYVNKNLMLELGYRFRPTDLETDLETTSTTATVDELSETYLSIMLMF